ncbi:hypothetical protein DYBT9275_02345 [Dyadobacter sp. CECT 9275]|uniref:Uncharacterized protein n=1 Tax=Dyadobacter helix TaxID=2822344 RepID=A0A916NBS8_9BACT|nr:hypothetical protein DYBT9275_02345 [Dyadobacter sp. CECT 9275]
MYSFVFPIPPFIKGMVVNDRTELSHLKKDAGQEKTIEGLFCV